MGTTTMGVKLDDATRERIKSAATRIDRTPHWLIKQAIFLISNNWKTAILCRSYLRCFLALPMRAMKHRLRQRNHTSHSSTLPSKFCPVGFPRRDHSGLSPPGNRSGFYAAGTSPPAAASC